MLHVQLHVHVSYFLSLTIAADITLSPVRVCVWYQKSKKSEATGLRLATKGLLLFIIALYLTFLLNSCKSNQKKMNVLITNSNRSSTDIDHHLIFMFIPFFHPTILKATAEAISVCGTGHQSDPALAKCPTNKLPHSCS